MYAIRSYYAPPDLDGVVPYKYAYNNRNGTPLYRRIPTVEEMETYEPDRKKPAKTSESKPTKSKRRRVDDGAEVIAATSASCSP